MVSTFIAFSLISVSFYGNQISIHSKKKCERPSNFSFRTMAGPSGLHVAYADIIRMLLENAEDSGSTNLRKSRDSDVDYTGRKLELK
jgi:hypothetical protein